jgi:hypothetical protein
MIGKIMTTTLAQKLNLKPENILEVVNVPVNWVDQLGKELADNPIVFSLSERPEAILIFVENKEQVEKIVFPVMPFLSKDCLVWLSYPKGTSGVKTDINRDILWKLMEPCGWNPVRMVALDEVWACMRFRPASEK